MKTKLVAMFGGLAVMASSLVPSLAMAHDRDDGQRFQWEQSQEREQQRAWLENEHARMHAENPYMTPWQHAAMHRYLESQQRQFNRRERREDRRYWRADRDEDPRWGDRDGRRDGDGRWDRDRDGRWNRDHDGRWDRDRR